MYFALAGYKQVRHEGMMPPDMDSRYFITTWGDMNRFRETEIYGKSIRIILPSLLTLCGFCMGLTSIRLVVEREWKLAVAAILIAGIFDFMDGFAARLLQGGSKLGAELDSLSDLVCFGVAPSILLYQWTLHETGWLGWSIVLLFCGCSALRLARFNTQTHKSPKVPSKVIFFCGIPAPAGALLILIPLFISFHFGPQLRFTPMIPGILVVLVSLLMITRFPTFSLKTLIRKKSHGLERTGMAFGVVSLFCLAPWATLTGAGLLYVITIPLSVLKHKELGAEPWT